MVYWLAKSIGWTEGALKYCQPLYNGLPLISQIQGVQISDFVVHQKFSCILNLNITMFVHNDSHSFKMITKTNI